MLDVPLYWRILRDLVEHEDHQIEEYSTRADVAAAGYYLDQQGPGIQNQELSLKSLHIDCWVPASEKRTSLFDIEIHR